MKTRSISFVLTAVVLASALAQLFQPAIVRTSHPGAASHWAVPAPLAVSSALTRACANCHSNATAWPWYAKISPVSWLIANDVQRARARMNFSDWKTQKHPVNEVEDACDVLSDHSMPPKVYVFVHHEARLSNHEVQEVCAWADSIATTADPADSTLRK